MITKLTLSGWIKANFIGWFAGIILIVVLSAIFEGLGISNLQFFIGIGMGAGVSFMQWRVLKKTVDINKRWVWHAVIGMGTPFLIFDILKQFTVIPAGTYYMLLSICSAGLFTGLLQYYILRPYTVRAGLWVAGSFVGWTLAALTVFSIDYSKYLSSNKWGLFSFNLIMILAGGVVLGIVTKAFLQKIIKRHEAFDLQ